MTIYAIHTIDELGGHILPVDPATIEQYTGVVDKNGKKVFEGDIIGYTDTDNETSVFGVVRWCSEGNFGINDHSDTGYDDEPFCNVGYMLKFSQTECYRQHFR